MFLAPTRWDIKVDIGEFVKIGRIIYGFNMHRNGCRSFSNMCPINSGEKWKRFYIIETFNSSVRIRTKPINWNDKILIAAIFLCFGINGNAFACIICLIYLLIVSFADSDTGTSGGKTRVSFQFFILR